MLNFLLSAFFSIVAIVLVQWIIFLLSRPKNAPPGPLPLPLIGSVYALLSLDGEEAALTRLFKKYGDAVTIYAGTSLTGMNVLIFGYDLMLEVSNNREIANVASDRPVALTEIRGVKEGIIWAQYSAAKERRQLLTKTFKQYGLLTSKLTPLQEDEIGRLVSAISANLGKPYSPDLSLAEALTSCVLLAVYSHRLDLQDPMCAEMYAISQKFFEGNRLQMMLLPYVKFLSLFVPDKLADVERRAETIMTKWLQDEIAIRKTNFDANNIKDILDAYMATDQSGKLDDGFMRSMLDTFGASSDTMQKSVSWALFYLAHMPDEQERLFKEIDAAVSSNAYPTIENRLKLPRLEAFLEESARYATMAVATFPRRCSAPIAFGSNNQYEMPTDSSIILMFYPSNHEDKYWLDPENFRVDRWLDPNGKFTETRRRILQFGAGRRACPGEYVARNLVFLFVGTLLQRFKWQLAEYVPFHSCTCQLTRIPGKYELIFTSRQ